MSLCRLLRSGSKSLHSRIRIQAVTHARSSYIAVQLSSPLKPQSKFLGASLPLVDVIPHSTFTSNSSDSKPEENVSILQRFKSAYKEYGKLLIGVHVATSCVWYGSFYYACTTGIDVVAILHKLNASEVIIRPFESTGLGHFAAAYLLYKLATPARYTVTILGTRYTANQLRKHGYLAPVPPGDNLKSLMKDTRGVVKDRYSEFKDDVREKVDDVKDRGVKVKGDVKEKIQDRLRKQ